MLIWKAFQNTEEWHFSFWNIFFHLRDTGIDIFRLCLLDQWWCHTVCNCCHDNSFAAGGVLLETKILTFVSKQKPSTPPNLMMEVKTIWELLYVCFKYPLSHFRDCIWGYLVFWQKETGAKMVAIETAVRVSFCFFCDAHLWCQVSRTLL